MKANNKKPSLTNIFFLIICLAAFQLVACTSNETYAPVVNAWQDPEAMKSRYRVQKDDTIYSIALAFELDYRDLARANGLTPPYRLKPGQTLSMNVHSETDEKTDQSQTGSAVTYAANDFMVSQNSFQEVDKTPKVEKKAIRKPALSSKTFSEDQLELGAPQSQINLPEAEFNSNSSPSPIPDVQYSQGKINEIYLEPLPQKTVALNQDKIIGQVASSRWQWPARGRILKKFSLQGEVNKGVDIGGHLGDPVVAVAPGKVVYSGSGLRGYGNLVIIKHSDNYLSAYAYNKRLLVKEGDVVKAGTLIGKMGQNDAGQILLHFEIRRNGKPVNPLLYL